MPTTVDDVRAFWEAHPLFTGESRHEPGSLEFFEEHRRVCIQECLGGRMDPRCLPPPENREGVLDLGCGPGFWLVEFAQTGCSGLVGADLTDNALRLARRRCEIYDVPIDLRRENAERTTFSDGVFGHVNCQGVIHHTPEPAACVREIARILRPGGTAGISVYYRNALLRSWSLFRPMGSLLYRLGARLPGRGREDIFARGSADEIVRRYDGARNPLGRCYSRGI